MNPESAPRVTLADVQNAIVDDSYVVLADGRTTACTLQLDNGVSVVGLGIASPFTPFDIGLGREEAYKRAIDKAFPLLVMRRADEARRAELAALAVPPQLPDEQVGSGYQDARPVFDIERYIATTEWEPGTSRETRAIVEARLRELVSGLVYSGIVVRPPAPPQAKPASRIYCAAVSCRGEHVNAWDVCLEDKPSSTPIIGDAETLGG